LQIIKITSRNPFILIALPILFDILFAVSSLTFGEDQIPREIQAGYDIIVSVTGVN